ncbi:hypothetical protein GE09DRAFT_1087447 [Coniochaeta sp. 2T2.1]|nr:hypothetical protein GE09DRAFT_1087447 [Coniochaeta sp. 2T2.1]
MDGNDQYAWVFAPQGQQTAYPSAPPLSQPSWQSTSQTPQQPSSPNSAYNSQPTPASNWAQLPPCPGSTLVQSWSWYGFENLVICPSCWASFASSTPLARLAPLQNLPIAEPRMCCLYSPRMRALWIEAGTNPSPAAVQQLLDFSLMRLDVYSATVPTVNYLRHQLMLQRSQAMHLSQMSTMYQGMDSMKIIAGTTDQYHEYGNNQLGWFRTEHGATSAQFEMERRVAVARADDPGTLAVIAELEARWMAVE